MPVILNEAIHWKKRMNETQLEAIARDEMDSFKPLTHLFDMPRDKDGQMMIYLNGNSLGPKPKGVEKALLQECDAWSRLGVRGHFDQRDPWVSYNELVTASLARLVGANLTEVVAAGTLTANLHFLFVSFYQPTKDRFKIIHLTGFPSDTYAIKSQVEQRSKTLQLNNVDIFDIDNAIIEIKPDANGYIDLSTFEQIINEHGESTSIIWIEAIHYLTGQYFDIAKLAQLAHAKGCKIGLDIAHAIGNVPLFLNQWQVDFAVWCSYKYLSAGPGGIAGYYVNEKYLNDDTLVRFAGWWGHNKITRFKMPNIFNPIATAESWQVSNPGIFLLAVLREALTLFDKVDLYALREKNKRLVAYLEMLLEKFANKVLIITPKNPEERGCQLSFRMQDIDVTKYEIEKIFVDEGIICDVRGNLIRVAPMGLYTSFLDVYKFVEKFKLIYQTLTANKPT